MGRTGNLFLLLLLSCLVFASFYNCRGILENHTDSGSVLILDEKIDSIGNHFIEGGKVLGFSIAVVQRGETIYNKGFGHVDTARTKPVTPDTRFLLASISKLVGTTLVMKLVEEGKLSLDDTLLELLPDFPNREMANGIKLHHLLSHTSGTA